MGKRLKEIPALRLECVFQYSWGVGGWGSLNTGGSAGVEPVNVWSVSLNETLNGSQEGGEGFLDNFIIGN